MTQWNEMHKKCIIISIPGVILIVVSIVQIIENLKRTTNPVIDVGGTGED